MKTVTEHLRQHLLDEVVGYSPRPVGDMPDLETLRETRWSPEFEQFMRNRLITGAFRYGYERLKDFQAKQNDFNYPEYIRRKLKDYEDTGNLESLVDVANIALIEFLVSKHPRKHFHAEDNVQHANPT